MWLGRGYDTPAQMQGSLSHRDTAIDGPADEHGDCAAALSRVAAKPLVREGHHQRVQDPVRGVRAGLVRQHTAPAGSIILD